MSEIKNVVTALVLAVMGVTGFAEIERPTAVAYWKMDTLVEGKVPDENGGYDLQLGPGCSLGDVALEGSGLVYDGTTNAWAKFSCPGMTDRTISLWFRRAATDGTAAGNTYPHLFGQFGGMRALYNFAAPDAKPSPALTFYAGSAPAYSGCSCAMPREEWVHIVVEYFEAGSAGTIRVFRNGVQVYEKTQTDITSAGTDEAFNGILGNQLQNGNRPICGVLDEVKVDSYAWDENEVLNEYLAGEPRTKTLVNRWTMDAISDGKVAPAAGSVDLTLSAGVSLTNGVDGSALWYDGSLDAKALFTVPETMYNFTVMAWVNQSQLQATQVVSGNSAPRFFACGSYAVFSSGPTGRTLSYTADGMTVSATALREGKESWSHVAISEEITGEDMGIKTVTLRLFVNGRLADEATGPYGEIKLKAAARFNFGSNGGNRPFHGALDDLRVYRGALTEEDVAAVYRGVADFSAGADFSVAAERATLAGRLDLTGRQPVQVNAPGTANWSLVSAPAGGEDAQILNPADPQTEVALPVVGTYVFRLTVAGDGAEAASDDVTVTRVAASAAVAPTVSVAASAASVTAPAPAELSATVSDANARISWRKVSGPGGVYFEPPQATSTAALFTAPGAYVLACRAENEAGAVEGTVAVTVTGAAAAGLPTAGLVHYWDFDTQYAGDDFRSRTVDRVTGTQLSYNNQTSISNLTVRSQAGYGFSVINFNDYLSLGVDDGGTDGASFSFWMYMDGSKDTSSTRILRSKNIEIWALNVRDADSKDPYLKVQISDAKGTWLTFDTAYLNAQLPKGLPRNRWSHVTVTVDKSASSDAAAIRRKVLVYIDGVAVEMFPPTVADGYSFAKLASNVFYLGYTTAARFFPGVIDEIRFYDRVLSPSEAARLAVDVTTVNRAPIVELTEATHQIPCRRTTVLAPAAVFDDGMTAADELTGTWELVSGDASRVAYSTTAALGLSVTATKAGRYAFRLRVSDGERTGSSVPVTVEVLPPALIFSVR